MDKTFTLRSIETVSDESIQVPVGGALCVVGGNNVGKSLFLREVASFFESGNQELRRYLVGSVNVDHNLIREDVNDWLESHAQRITDSIGRVMYASEGRRAVDNVEPVTQYLFDHDPPNYFDIGGFFLRLLRFEERASVVTNTLRYGSVYEMTTPMDLLFRNGELEEEISAICLRSFGFPLTLDRATGAVQLRVGEVDIPIPAINRPTEEYARAIEDLPPLAEQGDGVKNFMGMILQQLTSKLSVTLIDEPEAFLHPAQCRALGELLGRNLVERNTQLIVATHDKDFLIGLLKSGAELSVLRLDRPSTRNTTFKSIDNDDIERVWSNPVLRFSNLLQGVFHRVVVLCEADADCLWYSAVAGEIGDELEIDTHEILFVPGGGKDQLPKSLKALQVLGVQVFVIVDFDAILDGQTVGSLTASLGISNDNLEKQTSSLRKTALNNKSYDAAKKNGIQGLGQGQESRQGRQIVDTLRSYGVLVVPIGEMESFDRTIDGHGTAWVTGALNRDLHRTSADAKDLMAPVINSLRMTSEESD